MAKSSFRDSKVTINSTDYYVTDFNFTDNYDEIDITDTGTSGNIKEYTGGFREISFSFTMIEDPTSADITMDTEYSIEVDHEGKTYVGDGKVLTKSKGGSIGSAATAAYTVRFTSAPTVTPLT